MSFSKRLNNIHWAVNSSSNDSNIIIIITLHHHLLIIIIIIPLAGSTATHFPGGHSQNVSSQNNNSHPSSRRKRPRPQRKRSRTTKRNSRALAACWSDILLHVHLHSSKIFSLPLPKWWAREREWKKNTHTLPKKVKHIPCEEKNTYSICGRVAHRGRILAFWFDCVRGGNFSAKPKSVCEREKRNNSMNDEKS